MGLSIGFSCPPLIPTSDANNARIVRRNIMSETCCFHMLRDSSLSCAQRALLQSNVHPVLLQHKWKGAVMSWRARLVIVYQSRAETVEILGKNGSMRHKHGCAFPQCSCLLVFLFIFAACANHREASTCQNRPSARRLQSGFSVSCTTSSKWQRRLFRSEHLGNDLYNKYCTWGVVPQRQNEVM